MLTSNSNKLDKKTRLSSPQRHLPLPFDCFNTNVAWHYRTERKVEGKKSNKATMLVRRASNFAPLALLKRLHSHGMLLDFESPDRESNC